MDLNVIICTYNRSASLKRTLESIGGACIPERLEWELTVVDNNSADDTRAVVESYRKQSLLPIVYLKEQKQGLSHARNRGINASTGKIIAFTDDDVIVDRNWIGSIVEAFAQYDVQCIGGRILPVWAKPKPKWLSEDLWANIALLDYGDLPLRMEAPNLWGANLAVKADVFEKYGLFETDRGRIPKKLYGGEEVQLLNNLLKHDEKILYLPHAVVHHCICKERMQKAYFRKWIFDKGELDGILFGDCTRRCILGIPYFAFKKAAVGTVAFLLSCFGFRANSFDCERRALYNLGFIAGRLKRRSGQGE